MANKLQLHIPEPCHESWENMSPVEKGRFCSSCQKQVVDFSVMNDREIAQFFKQPLKNSVCGHFSGTQLNRDIDIPRKRIPWVKYFFQVAIPAFLLSMKAGAQTQKMGKVKPATTCTAPDDIMIRGDVAYVPVTTEFTIKVTDETGEPIRNAIIKSKSSNKQAKTDGLGLFKMKVPAGLKEEEFTVSSKGYLTAVIKITATDWRRGSANIVLYNPEVQIDGMILPVRIQKPVPIIDTIVSLFTASKINPSPVYQGNAFNVEWKSKKEEKVYVNVCAPDGRTMLFVPFDVVIGENELPINTDEKWEAGDYTVKLVSVTGKQLLSEKLTVVTKQEAAVKIKEEKPIIDNLKEVVERSFPHYTPMPTLGAVSTMVIAIDDPIETLKSPVSQNGTGKIMPNPVMQGQAFMVEWKSKANEKLSLRISAIDGKELMTMPVPVTKGTNRIPVNTDNNWIPGVYVVVLYNEKGKLLLSEKIVIQ